MFVTGFNEWTAQRLQFVDNEPIGFCDNCTTEYSRDLEPAANELGDNYYMQLVNYIARFKGTTAVLPRGSAKTVDIAGDASQWDNVTAVYTDYRGDTAPRNSAGFGSLRYVDDSGRNDILRAKIAEDKEYLYFYVETADSLTYPAPSGWMTLFLNVSGKEGYDFCVNRTSPLNGITAVEAVRDGGYAPLGSADIVYRENLLTLRVEKALLGFKPGADASFTFKWADNYIDGDIYSFYTRGEAAPYGRLNWVYNGIYGK